MISVIIPVLNEAKTIGKIVRNLKQNRSVDEIIVVDDKSCDSTVAKAKKEGAMIITSTKIGKGASMRDGFLVSKGKIIVFLDGDVEEYDENIIIKLTSPLLNDEADFVKGTFTREAGRVTELVAKPLLSILFQEFSVYSQPLSGIIAGKREFFKKIIFEDDYGVDIGILIDIHGAGARIKEIQIGEVKHRMKLWRELTKMSREVSRAILKRAFREPFINLKSLQMINIVSDQMEFSIKETLLKLKKMIIFDMDNTILQGSFIDKLAEHTGLENAVMSIRASNHEHHIITKNIARLFKGLSIAELLKTVDSIPLVKNIGKIVKVLKKRGYIVGIITHSYDCIADHIKNKIDLDFALANELEFSNSITTGEVKIPSFFIRYEESRCSHDICKLNVLINISKKYNINLDNIIFVGDSEQDLCVIKHVGIGVAFCSESKTLRFFADKIIDTNSFKPILEFAR